MKRLAVLFVLLFALLGCLKPLAGPQYYEIVFDKADCNPYCSTEFIVLSNGLVFKKESYSRSVINNQIEIVKVSEDNALQAIKSAQESVGEQKTERCENCNSYVLFLEKKGRHFMFSAQEKDAPESVKKVFDDSTKLFLEGNKTEQFFVQFVFKRPGQNTADFHFFSDGTVLREDFSANTQILAGVEVFLLEKEKIDLIRGKISSDLFDSRTGIENCFEKGLEYGYLEVQMDEQYGFFWTCGAQSSKADELFNDLLKEFG